MNTPRIVHCKKLDQDLPGLAFKLFDTLAQRHHASHRIGRRRRVGRAEAARCDELVAARSQQEGAGFDDTAADPFRIENLDELVEIDTQPAARCRQRGIAGLHPALDGQFDQLPRLGRPAVFDEHQAPCRLGVSQTVLHASGRKPRSRHHFGSTQRKSQRPRRGFG